MAPKDSHQTEYIEIAQRKPAHLAADATVPELTSEATEVLEEAPTAPLDDAPTTLIDDAPTTLLEADPTTAVEADPTTLLAKEGQTELLDETPQTELLPNAPAVDDGEDEALIALKNLEKRRADKRRSRLMKIAGGIGVAALVAGALFLRSRLSATSQQADLGPEVGIVERRDFSTSVQGSGSLEPISMTVVTPEVDGIIDTVSVKEGQSVGAGDVLFTIRSEQIDKAIGTTLARRATAMGRPKRPSLRIARPMRPLPHRQRRTRPRPRRPTTRPTTSTMAPSRPRRASLTPQMQMRRRRWLRRTLQRVHTCRSKRHSRQQRRSLSWYGTTSTKHVRRESTY